MAYSVGSGVDIQREEEEEDQEVEEEEVNIFYGYLIYRMIDHPDIRLISLLFSSVLILLFLVAGRGARGGRGGGGRGGRGPTNTHPKSKSKVGLIAAR